MKLLETPEHPINHHTEQCPASSLLVGLTDRYGKSLFAGRTFEQGDVVLTVSGPIVTGHSIYTVPIDFDLCIDPYGYGRYLNHSCNPTCGIQNRNQVVAMQPITMYQEITIDYGMIIYEYDQFKLKQDITCSCGSSYCRSVLGSYKNMPASLKEYYNGYISEYLTQDTPKLNNK